MGEEIINNEIINFNFYCLNDDCNVKDIICIPLTEEESDEVYCADCEEKLKRVGRKGPAVWASETDRLKKTQSYFRDRATKHAQSEESQHLKKKVEDRELTNIGYKKKK